jgi:molecular chaperone GrpE (heat shock protein)
MVKSVCESSTKTTKTGCNPKMGRLSFLRRKSKSEISSAVQRADPDIGERLTGICERLHKVESKQKEISLQLEEIDAYLHNGGDDEYALVDALIALADTIEDFYHFAAESEDPLLFEQTQMMWNAAKSAAGNAGLEIIEKSDEPFDFQRCSVESTGYDGNMPIGYVIKTLKCGYINKDEMMRRAVVVLNKAHTPNEET